MGLIYKKNILENRFNINDNMVNKALQYAKDKHKGQLDDDNNDYFKAHILNVYNIAKQVSDDNDFLCAAILHDTIEDCEVSAADIEREFNKNISELVMELTHDKTDNGNVFPRLCTKQGIMLKFCDRLSNLSRMDNWNINRQNQYLRRSKFWKSSEKDMIILGQKKGEDI